MTKCKLKNYTHFSHLMRITYILYRFNTMQLESNIARTNVIYGHMNPAVRNVFFTHGQLDPWRPMGLQEDLNEHSPAVVIPSW